MQEQGHDLGIDVGLEEEGSHVGERHDRNRVEHEQHPDALIVLVEHEAEHNDENDGNVGHQNIENHIGGPVARQGHS
jgi:hypothetical protein